MSSSSQCHALNRAHQLHQATWDLIRALRVAQLNAGEAGRISGLDPITDFGSSMGSFLELAYRITEDDRRDICETVAHLKTTGLLGPGGQAYVAALSAQSEDVACALRSWLAATLAFCGHPASA